jgi:hypothetical protein
MEKVFGDFFEFIVFLVVFVFLLFPRKKKRKTRQEEEPQSSSQTVSPSQSPLKGGPLSAIELCSSIEKSEVHSEIETRHLPGLLLETPARKAVPHGHGKRMKGRQFLLSYEAFSLPLSLRPPRV